MEKILHLVPSKRVISSLTYTSHHFEKFLGTPARLSLTAIVSPKNKVAMIFFSLSKFVVTKFDLFKHFFEI